LRLKEGPAVFPHPFQLSQQFGVFCDIHFLLASSFISCHNWSTARRRRAVSQNWKAARIATFGFSRAQSIRRHHTELPQCANPTRLGGSRHS
jgi:hypothetical protein